MARFTDIEEREFARKLAEACLRDRLTTFGCRGTIGKKGRVEVARIAPKTDAEIAWEAYLHARTP